MKTFLLYLFAIAVVMALVVSCGRDAVPLPGIGPLAIEGATIDRTGERFEAMVVIHETVEELNQERDKTIRDNDLEQMTEISDGWSVLFPDGSCEIHVLRVESVRDKDRLATLGHELAHCLYGNYHR